MPYNEGSLPRVGYWWSDKKCKRFYAQKNAKNIVDVCRENGLEFVKLDLEKPLEVQGPFDAIVHKLSTTIVKAQLGDDKARLEYEGIQEYTANHPEIVIIDPLDNIKRLLDRSLEYSLVEKDLHEQGAAFIPAYVKLTTTDIGENLAKMKKAGVTFPCVCKPILAHGCSMAHQMCLIFNEAGLKDITVPCVAQSFINHSAILYKLSVMGKRYFLNKRPSLKNFTAGDQSTIFFDSTSVSKPSSASDLNELDETEPKPLVMQLDKSKLNTIASILCQKIGLSLMGADIIVENGTGRYAIIDINIFPGFEEVDAFFPLLCDFVKSKILQHKQEICLSECNKTTKDAKNGELVKDSIAKNIPKVTSYSNKCFCCPISGLCENASEACSACYKQPNFKEEFSESLSSKVAFNDDKGPSVENSNSFQSPDSNQEDSGIETSDSCDEKKNSIILKPGKRLHSKAITEMQVVSRLPLTSEVITRDKRRACTHK